MDYGDFEVAREVVKVCGACGSRSLVRVLDNAVDILLVAVALNRGCGLVTTDRWLVCGCIIKSLLALAECAGAMCLGALT